MDLRELTFGHVDGFDNLKESDKTAFIDLFRSYVKQLNPQIYGETTERHVKSVYKTKKGNFRLSFFDRADVTLKTKKEEQTKKERRWPRSFNITISTHDIDDLKRYLQDTNILRLAFRINTLCFNVLYSMEGVRGYSDTLTKSLSGVGRDIAFLLEWYSTSDEPDYELLYGAVSNAVFFFNSLVLISYNAYEDTKDARHRNIADKVHHFLKSEQLLLQRLRTLSI